MPLPPAQAFPNALPTTTVPVEVPIRRYKDLNDRPTPGTCCEMMKHLWKARHYMAVTRLIWTADGLDRPHCGWCGAPVVEEGE